MTKNPPDLSRRINHAISAAVGDEMRAYAAEQAGHELPPLAWSLTPTWGLNGHAGGAHRESGVAGVLARWAQALGLTQVATSPNMAGSVTYTGDVEGRHVVIWGVTDRDAWEQPTIWAQPTMGPADTPLPWELQVATAIRAVFPAAAAEEIIADEAIGALNYRLRQHCQDMGLSPEQALRALSADDREFCARADQPAAFLASRIRDGAR